MRVIIVPSSTAIIMIISNHIYKGSITMSDNKIYIKPLVEQKVKKSMVQMQSLATSATVFKSNEL